MNEVSVFFGSKSARQSNCEAVGEDLWLVEATSAASIQGAKRCCEMTEGVYTWLGCIIVTVFFLGVATVKFLGYSLVTCLQLSIFITSCLVLRRKKYQSPAAERKHCRLLLRNRKGICTIFLKFISEYIKVGL